ncbi:MAG TPA: dihydrodipicolinate synthase family protein [Acidimicrobiia bacterium]
MTERTVTIPLEDGSLVAHTLGEPARFERPTAPLTSRRPFAAAHVVADPLADNTPGSGARVDWDATLSFRRHLWSWGLPVAEAMDTAQRGMGLDWAATRELITRSVTEAKAEGGEIACGANTDQLSTGTVSHEQIVDAYHEQIALIEGLGGQAVVMASRHLAAIARGPEDYQRAYAEILGHVSDTAIVHWLGDMFDPALAGYWGSADLDAASDSFIAIVTENADKVDGVKISLLDKEREIDLRRRLPQGVRMYTGDDFDYPTTIRGDGEHHSDAFLGAFDLIAPAASSAIQALDAGEFEQFDKILAPTLPLSRHVFSTPTWYYKTGVVFMAYLCGHQDHFRMVDGLESARSVVHLARQFVLADQAGLLPDPDLAAHRMRLVLELAGVGQAS